MEMYAILGDGSEHTMLLTDATQFQRLQGITETLKLHTVHQDIKTVHAALVFFSILPAQTPQT